MPVKGTIGTDHLPRNKYVLNVVGIGVPLTCTKVGETEQELEVATLSDRVVVSGGNTTAFEVDVETPAHHYIEQAAWQKWYDDSTGDTALDYKKPAVLTLISSSGIVKNSWILKGVFPRKRKLSDLDMENEGEDARVTWTLSVDEMVPVAVL
jgi:hypothetical protein